MKILDEPEPSLMEREPRSHHEGQEQNKKKKEVKNGTVLRI
jgi:hypothetical protein